MAVPEIAGPLLTDVREALGFSSGVTGSVTVGLVTSALRLWSDVIEGGAMKPVPEVGTESNARPTFFDLVDFADLDSSARKLVDTAVAFDEDLGIEALKSSLAGLERLLQDQLMRTRMGLLPPVDLNAGPAVYNAIGLAQPFEEFGSAWLFRAINLQQQIPVVENLRFLAARVHEGADAVSASQEALARSSIELANRVQELATAEAGLADVALAKRFEDLAASELWWSWSFRIGTGLLLAAAVGLGVFGASTAQTVRAAIGHAVLVLSVAGASAYTGRLGSQHRTTGDWAKTIEVQLKTFQAFLATVQDQGVRDRVYEDFGRRVLGAPPRTTGRYSSDEASTLPLAQVIELAANLASRPK